jgi:uncharacterized glyoxalase superfamily protein PhnB
MQSTQQKKKPEIQAPNFKQIEPVIFADNFHALIDWYVRILGFEISQLDEENHHYCKLHHKSGMFLGIADAKELAVTLVDRSNSAIVLQLQVPDVQSFFKYLETLESHIAFGPSFDSKCGFWYGGFHDLEGNSFWVVDENCP